MKKSEIKVNFMKMNNEELVEFLINNYLLKNQSESWFKFINNENPIKSICEYEDMPGHVEINLNLNVKGNGGFIIEKKEGFVMFMIENEESFEWFAEKMICSK